MSETTIFIVEDEAIIAMDLAGKLGHLGYTVCGSTASGEDALIRIQELRPDLVLMDIQLSGAMDGVETAERIRRDYDIPVIYLTAHSDRATLARAKHTEPFGYLLKPFEQLELETHIEMALYKHQAERRLRESEERWRVTLGSIGDAVIASDTAGCVTYLNPIAEALTGWSTVEAQGQKVPRIFTIINEQTGAPADDLVARVLRENRVVELANHTALVTRDGRVIPIEDSAAPIRDAVGHVSGVVVVFHDVTEKRRAEEQQARLASFPQLNPNPIVEVDLLGQIHFCNPAAEVKFPDLLALGSAHPWLADWESVVHEFHAMGRREVSREIVIEDSFYQQTMHYIVSIRRIRIYGLDITARKHADIARERLLRDVQLYAAETAAIFEALPGAVYFGTSAGITRCNARGLEMLGAISLTDLQQRISELGEKFRVRHSEYGNDLVAPEHLPFTRGLHGEVAQLDTWATNGATGENVLIRGNAAPVRVGNEIVGAVAINVDITDRYRQQEQMQTFIHMVSHDLRAPLVALRGQIGLLREGVAEIQTPQLRRSMDAIDRAMKRMDIMIDDLVAAARLEGGQLILCLTSLDLACWLPDFLERFPIDPQRIALEMPAAVPAVQADSDRLERILTNLLSNALNYSTPDTPIRVAVQVRNGALDISVADQGKGIPSSDLSHLFQKFYRADRHQRAEGTGLGLFITQLLVEAHGGYIRVDSVVGEGSTFTVTFPCQSSSSTE